MNNVAIIGLGYVGLTLATVMAENGFRVYGIERRKDVVDLTNKGIPHFSETGLEESLQRVIESKNLSAHQKLDLSTKIMTYIITVGTPLDHEGNARLDMIKNATKEVADHMSDGALIILRSTVKIGTSRKIVSKIIEKSGKKFSIAMCPERTLEGSALSELRFLPQIIGSNSDEGFKLAEEIFSNITNTTIHVSNLETAEVIKLVDNSYRDVQFGFANEIARVCEPFGISANEVVMSGKNGYPRTNLAIPGLVGGPCLEKDPHILTQSLADQGVTLDIIPAARSVNERQPFETVQFIFEEIANRKIPENCKVAILGLAFKGVPETNDLRGSMSLKVIDAVINKLPNIKLSLFDPVVSEDEIKSLYPSAKIEVSFKEAIKNSSVVLICTNHPKLSAMHPKNMLALMATTGFIYDYWNSFSSLNPHESNFSYYAVGNTNKNV